MANYYESSDDGYIFYSGGSYSSTVDYDEVGSNYIIQAQWSDALGTFAPEWQRRACKRFLLGLSAGVTVSVATLYWYLHDIPVNTAQKSCNLEQINDYLTLGSEDWAITVKKDYGACMTYNQAAGWISQDVTTEIAASKTDAYVAFRWRIATIPTGDTGQTFRIRAYEDTAYKAYLAITLAGGWAHNRDGVANASIGKIDGTAKASVGKVDGT